ncbi:hypothetical protein R6Q59_016224 [Mikania micrantha]
MGAYRAVDPKGTGVICFGSWASISIWYTLDPCLVRGPFTKKDGRNPFMKLLSAKAIVEAEAIIFEEAPNFIDPIEETPTLPSSPSYDNTSLSIVFKIKGCTKQTSTNPDPEEPLREKDRESGGTADSCNPQGFRVKFKYCNAVQIQI